MKKKLKLLILLMLSCVPLCATDARMTQHG